MQLTATAERDGALLMNTVLQSRRLPVRLCRGTSGDATSAASDAASEAAVEAVAPAAAVVPVAAATATAATAAEEAAAEPGSGVRRCRHKVGWQTQQQLLRKLVSDVQAADTMMQGQTVP